MSQSDSAYLTAGVPPLLPRLSWQRVGVFVALLSMFVHWVSIGDHSLYSPDEGRYGRASLTMVESGNWVVPVLDGRPHLTKPPLTYWLQAISVGVFGKSEFAVRLPSVIAGSVTVLMTFILASHMRNRRSGIMAMVLLSIMPIHVIVSRLAITDPLLTCFWMGALTSGFLAVKTLRPGLSWTMWACVAGALMTKGPLGLVPVLVILLWITLAGRWSDLDLLRIHIGLPIAVAPLLAWAAMALAVEPAAMDVWINETLSRASGTGDHPEPWFYFIPIFLAGAFPATAMLVLPGWNVSFGETIENLRNRRDSALLAIAVVVPFVLFSVVAGKLATYILPVCPPLAVLTALMLDDWIAGRYDCPRVNRRPPDVVYTLAATTSLVTITVFVAVAYFNWRYSWAAVPLFALPALSLVLVKLWHQGATGRLKGLLLIATGSAALWIWGFEVEDFIVEPRSSEFTLTQVQSSAGSEPFALATYGYGDDSLAFYRDAEVPELRTPEALKKFSNENTLAGKEVRILADAVIWSIVQQRWPDVGRGYREIERRTRWVNRDTLLLEPIAAVRSQDYAE